MSKTVTPAEFARLTPRAGSVAVRSDGRAAGANASGRTVSFVFSDDSVGRDGHRILAGAWDTKNYQLNPVVLFGHDQSSMPIGRTIGIGEVGGKLKGTVEFASASLSEFADAVYRMTKEGFLNAVSVSWKPLKWKYSGDRSRPGGIDFERAELCEVSVVPVPALATALVTARSRGIDVAPFARWADRLLASHSHPVDRTALTLIRNAASGEVVSVTKDEVEALRAKLRHLEVNFPRLCIRAPGAPAFHSLADEAGYLRRCLKAFGMRLKLYPWGFPIG